MVSDHTTISLVVSDIESRAALGLIKYGVTLDRTDLSRRDWLQHSYEECLDMACYLRRLIQLEDANHENADYDGAAIERLQTATSKD